MPLRFAADFEATAQRPFPKTVDLPRARPLPALAAIYGGAMLQLVCDWAVKFNANELGGLIDRKAPGRQSSSLNHARAATVVKRPAADNPWRAPR